MVKVTCAVPVVLTSFLISTPCYLLASYVGTGRFEILGTPSSLTDDKMSVMFQNICGQDPWARFTGGVTPPLEAGPNGMSRVDSILSQILEKRPVIYCGQEFDDLGVSEKIGRALAQAGYTCIRDWGCDDPFLNHSGLFIATRIPAESISFHEFRREDMSGITKYCNRGVLEVDLRLLNGQPLKVVNLHLSSGENLEDQNARLKQLNTYVFPLMEKGPRLL